MERLSRSMLFALLSLALGAPALAGQPGQHGGPRAHGHDEVHRGWQRWPDPHHRRPAHREPYGHPGRPGHRSPRHRRPVGAIAVPFHGPYDHLRHHPRRHRHRHGRGPVFHAPRPPRGRIYCELHGGWYLRGDFLFHPHRY